MPKTVYPACPIYPVGPVDRTGVEFIFPFISSGFNFYPVKPGSHFTGTQTIYLGPAPLNSL